jgi:PEP-CTERM motif
LNIHESLKLGALSLAVLAMAAFAPSASAGVIGTLAVANCAGGGVTVGNGTIDWLPEVAGPPESACLQLGATTNVTGTGLGTLSPLSPNGTINDLPPNGGIAGFMSFGLFHFDPAAVGGFGPGSGVSCSVDPGVNNSCSITGSPFLLTETATGTAVTLLAHGTILDGSLTTSFWNGNFTTQLTGLTPSQVQAAINAPGTITSTFSGTFNVSPVPEPVSMALIGGGLIALAAFKRRKRA